VPAIGSRCARPIHIGVNSVFAVRSATEWVFAVLRRVCQGGGARIAPTPSAVNPCWRGATARIAAVGDDGAPVPCPDRGSGLPTEAAQTGYGPALMRREAVTQALEFAENWRLDGISTTVTSRELP
jgi:hypothetical protein